MAPVLLSFLTALALWIVADRGYSSHAFGMLIWSLGSRPAIPARRNEAAVACPAWIYTNRNLVERLVQIERMACRRDALREDRALLHGRALHGCNDGLAQSIAKNSRANRP